MFETIKDLGKSRNIMYHITSALFIAVIAFIICFSFFSLGAADSGKLPEVMGDIVIISVIVAAFVIACYFMIFTNPVLDPLIRFKCVTKWIRLKPSEFRYSLVEKTLKYIDGHSETCYMAFVQFERFGEKYNIGWRPGKHDPLTPDILDASNINLELFKRTSDINIVINEYYYFIYFPYKEMAEYAIETIKKRVNENPETFDKNHYELISIKEKTV